MTTEQTRNTSDRSAQEIKNPLIKDLITAGTPPELIARVCRLIHTISILKTGMGIAKESLTKLESINTTNNIFVDLVKLVGGRGREGLERKEVSKRERENNGWRKTEREQYGELLQSVRSDGLRQFIAGRISDAQAGGQARNFDVDAGGLCAIPVRDSQEGGSAKWGSGRSSTVLTNGGGINGVAYQESQNNIAGTAKAITIPFRRMD